ncbi:HAD-IA family hydrolase [Spiribacter pallidus]|jgi:putative hydrolase of the HAD superfamily|uniref:HAD-IA family hydrolase n=1 Tax=Spiribacter pallidus TaxID=1987936 RepID=A0ABV3T9Y1_9GAMM
MIPRPLQAPVAVVMFDLDFTLWDLSGVIPHAEQVCQGLLEQRYPAVAERFDIESQRSLRVELAEQHPELAHDVTRLRRASLERIGAVAGYQGAALQALVEEAFTAFIDARHAVTLYDDTLPLLRALRGQVRLGALTNGNADVHRIGLGEYFDFTLSAVELGAAKPSHLVYETAARRAGAPAAEIVHVGDDVHTDVYGAANFGMQAVWLNRDGAHWPDEVPAVPHHAVGSLAELEGMLLGLLRAA